MIEYTLIRSGRRSIGIEVRPTGEVIVRVPYRCPKKLAEAFLLEKEEWILQALAKQQRKENAQKEPPFTDKELSLLKKRARTVLVPLVEELSKEIGVSYGTISIRAQKTRWGSCSAKGNLNFNCLLALMPENVQRYVAVHELCHRKEMNHSKAFWNEVAKYQPTYLSDRRQLKKDGRALIEKIR